MLWGDGQAANPANALQAQIGQLRRTLGAAAIVTSEAGYALDVQSRSTSTSSASSSWWPRAGGWPPTGEPASASAALGEALGLRRGEPLAEFAYAGFADAERAHLDELTLVAIEARAGADLALGRHGELVGELEALCREHPLRERLWELLILALYRSGRQAEALRAYAEVRDHLVDELGLDPGPALRELEARILAQDPSLAPASALARPAPVPAAGGRATVRAGNLRERLGRFVGRDAELEQLREAVRSCRLVTLTGPGGAGKTRLAVEAAAALRREHRDGAWLVELAGVTEPDGVAPAAAAALGAAAAALGEPSAAGSTAELIVRHLAGRSLVVVLDNCEHVIDEAAALADTLVGAVPGLRLIATSREPLGVPGEVLVPVGGLAPAAAVELFVDRARAVRPGFSADGRAAGVIEDICRRLDGLPLAVELAAARLRALPLATLAERLDDRFRLLSRGARTALPRQQTLRAVVDWSYDLLFEDERRLFARLAVVHRRLRARRGRGRLRRRPGAGRRDPRCPQPAGRQVPRHRLRRRRRGPVRPAPDAVAVRQGTARRIRRSRRHAGPPRGVLPAAGHRSPPGPARRHRAGVPGPSRRGVGQPAGRARLVHRHGRCRRGAVAGLGDGLAVVHQRRLPRRSPLAR